MVLELAPLAAGVVVAGRMGASLGAGLGAMTLTEQIDALESQGLSPMRELTAPRVFGVHDLRCRCSPCSFPSPPSHPAGWPRRSAAPSPAGSSSTSRLHVLTLRDAVPPLLKTMVFGWLIGASGCYFGMNARGGAEGVGHAATAGVVACACFWCWFRMFCW